MPAAIPALPSPPRRVVPRSRASTFGRWSLRIFIFPHTLVGLAGLFVVPFLFCWAIAGQIVHGELVDKRSGTHTVGKSDTRAVRYWDSVYVYTFQGKEYRKSVDVDQTKFDALPIDSSAIAALHQPIDLRVLGIGKLHHADRADKSPWGTVRSALLFVAFWNAIVSVFVYVAWVAPYRERKLVVIGLARPGTILSITDGGSEGRTRAGYEFQSDGRLFQRKMGGVYKPAVAAYPEGSAVTVLVHPFNERRSLVYEFSNYRAEGARL